MTASQQYLSRAKQDLTHNPHSPEMASPEWAGEVPSQMLICQAVVGRHGPAVERKQTAHLYEGLAKSLMHFPHREYPKPRQWNKC